jgi:hypothetical protein
MELFRSDEGDTYTLISGEYQTNGIYKPAHRHQFFQTESKKIYEVSFLPLSEPPVTELMFGVVEDNGLINFHRSPTSGTSQVIKIFNTVVKAAVGYDQAQDWGVPVWLFTSTGDSRTRMYERLARRIAEQTKSKIFKLTEWGQTVFLVYQNTSQGKAAFKKCIDFYNEFKGEDTLIRMPEL